MIRTSSVISGVAITLIVATGLWVLFDPRPPAMGLEIWIIVAVYIALSSVALELSLRAIRERRWVEGLFLGVVTIPSLSLAALGLLIRVTTAAVSPALNSWAQLSGTRFLGYFAVVAVIWLVLMVPALRSLKHPPVK